MHSKCCTVILLVLGIYVADLWEITPRYLREACFIIGSDPGYRFVNVPSPEYFVLRTPPFISYIWWRVGADDIIINLYLVFNHRFWGFRMAWFISFYIYVLVISSGNSAVQAISLLLKKGVPETNIIFLNLISVSYLLSNHTSYLPSHLPFSISSF